ncbi:LysR family regulatory protein, putative [Talaromyces stipitatus ATCC 10500]|uniref:LysR family regulatory protein, putative n=1 Tax=Talaromyces stipitatus (strain ATCC 10500 / CBS 375.48 / QM 6759 / NRRL 1006) TaxID=441959 RepID=B8M652_TALSN|nr:LysR family regulatory protein, putative [Talaromyces stipitatus ATCC 10500]EED19052.1 LysR family regulatory protein, putative [Talaromyces stipitatus ATCC 10500]
MGLFSSSRPAPETVPSDRIIPLSLWDDQDYARAISLDITLTFNDVLDPEKLRDSLDILLRKKGWQKFGARLRRNKDKKLEYHIPEQFDEKRPAFLFSIERHDMTLAEHPQLSAYAFGELDKPTLLGPFDPVRPYLRAANAPERLDDWLYSDSPQLAVHVVVLKDMTFVTVTFIHLLMDAMGFTALLRGWTAVLRGREDQIPPIVDVDEDPLATIHQMTPASRYVLADRLLKGWGFILFVIQYLFELLWWRRDDERLIFVPKKYLKELRDSALAELNDSPSQDTKPPFISESDVLLSWWTRVFIKALNPSPNKPITLMNVFDIRGILADMGLLPTADTALIANVTWGTITLVTAGEIVTKPLSHLASRIRHAIDTHRTPEQVQAIAAMHREALEKTGQPALFGDAGTMLFTCSNWHKGKLFQMDFSPAVIKTNPFQSGRANLPGRPLLVSATGKFVGFSARNSLAVMGKDAAGNWWMKNVLRTSLWSRIEEQFGTT